MIIQVWQREAHCTTEHANKHLVEKCCQPKPSSRPRGRCGSTRFPADVLDQLKVMSAIESCRTAALGGHVVRCEDCAYTTIAYNSCRNRHYPKCQGAAAKQLLAERAAELLPVPYLRPC